MLRPSASQSISSSQRKTILHKVASIFFEKSSQTTRKISPRSPTVYCSYLLLLVNLLFIISFAACARGLALNRESVMDTANRKQFTETTSCKHCIILLKMVSSYAAKRWDTPTSKESRNTLKDVIKTLRQDGKELTFLKLHLIRLMLNQHQDKMSPKLINSVVKTEKPSFVEEQGKQNIAPVPSSHLPLQSKTLSRSKRMATGDRRLVHMQCKTQYLLEINSKGMVGGSREKTSNTLLEIQSVKKGGVVRFYSPHTGYYLAMNKSGRLYGTKNYTIENCAFLERSQQNHWNTYSSYALSGRHRRNKRSVTHPWYVAIGKSGRPRKANRIRSSQNSAQFLPRNVS